MKYTIIWFYLFLFINNSNLYSLHPRFRDEFYIENKTRSNIVVVFESIGLLGANFEYLCDENIISLNMNGRADAPGKTFRTIQSRRLFQIGFSQYDYENFNRKPCIEKFEVFFNFILIFSDKGDLLHRIDRDNFNKYKIEDRTNEGPGVYVLVIEWVSDIKNLVSRLLN